MSQKSLKTHLQQAEQAGIYRLPVADRTALEKTAEALGFASFKVNLDGATKLDAILAALGRDLDFPEWYGANLDALNDCLTDFSWREAKGYVVTLSGIETAPAEPDSFAALNEVFSAAIKEWQAQGVPFWLFYEFSSAGRTEGLASLPVLK